MVKLIRSTGSGKNYDSGDLVKENTGRLGCYLVDLGDLGDDFALWTKDVCPGRYGTRQTVAARCQALRDRLIADRDLAGKAEHFLRYAPRAGYNPARSYPEG